MVTRARAPRRLVGLWLLLAALSAPALGDEHAGVRFEPPAGWETAEHDGARLLAPRDLAAGETFLAIVAGAQPATSSSPADQIAEIAAAMNQGAQVTARGEVVSTDRAALGQLHVQAWEVTDAELGAHTRLFAILVRGGERAVLVIICRPSAILARYEAALRTLLGSLELAGASVPAPARPATGKLPTGDTPDMFPGTPGWLPSGRGVQIPAPRLADGKPEGLWWTAVLESGGRLVVRTTIFLADGTRASNPRPGGGELFDVDGQRRQKGATGLGTFKVVDGQLTQTYDGFESTDAFRAGADADGPFFMLGAARYQPLEKATAAALVGTWGTSGGKYVFKADGTYESGHVSNTSDWTLAVGGRGTFELDGYLIALRPRDAPMWITTVGVTGSATLVLGPSMYRRE